MNGHDEYLELLAASIDFGLTEEEVARLNYHLASCPECRRAATELRGQNAVIATTPIAPLAPARSEQILRAALRKPATKPRWGMLAVAALLATLGGGVLFAGVQLITDDDPAPDQSPPIVAEVSAPPSEAPAEESADPGAPPPDDGPRVTPNPGDDESPPGGSGRARVPAAVLARHRADPRRAGIRRPTVGHVHAWSRHGASPCSSDRPAVGGQSCRMPTDCMPLAAATEACGSLCFYNDVGTRSAADGCAASSGCIAFVRTARIAGRLPRVAPGGASVSQPTRAHGRRLGLCYRVRGV